MLSVVSSVALNTTLLIKERNVSTKIFRLQREVLQNLRDQLRIDRAHTLARTPEICRQLVKVGLNPADYGLDENESATASADVQPFHRNLSWFDVLFSRRKVYEQRYPAQSLNSDKQWERDLIELLNELEEQDSDEA
ncbi:hypothetical protein MYAM1_002915 [Malassezia yamatoensis]|uniref:Uncharacterized protein n=1 Tax=Malassezia yamatoensis TaxID=253288 RepID=A0AAJ6CHE1_9BASI|nr:hypothetical protein MYAM1_002915 [Malassezia yamatoensis]